MNIYIGSLPAKTSAKELTSYFKMLVKVLDLKRIKNKGRKSPGYAILKVSSQRDFDKLMSTEHFINGSRLTLKPYLTPSERLELEKSLIRKRVYVKNLPDYAPVDGLKHAFSIFGDINSVVIKKKQLTDATYGFVTFETESSAVRCLQQGFVNFLGQILEIKDYKINHSKFKKELSYGKQGKDSLPKQVGLRNHGQSQDQVSRQMAQQSEVKIEQSNLPGRSNHIQQQRENRGMPISASFQGYPRPAFVQKANSCWFSDQLVIRSIVRKDSYLSKKHDLYNLRYNKRKEEARS